MSQQAYTIITNNLLFTLADTEMIYFYMMTYGWNHYVLILKFNYCNSSLPSEGVLSYNSKA